MKHLKYMLLMLAVFAASAQAADYRLVMQQLINKGDLYSEKYDPEQALKFGNAFSGLYFGGFEGEGLEFAVGQADANYMIGIELKFSQLIGSAMAGENLQKVQGLWLSLRDQLQKAPMIEQDGGYWQLVLQSWLILLREGVEALLVIAALLAYLRKSGAADRAPLVWAGVAFALLASALTAWGLQVLIKSSGATREVIEGVTVLVAAMLLSYVSFWLFSRRETQQWQRFVATKLESAVDRKSLMAIVSVAFFAVYREGAETILFYQALVTSADYQWEPILLGAGIALLSLAVVYMLIFILSIKLPLKVFFSATAALLFTLSIIFAGKGVLELQVSGWFPTTIVGFVPTISWLGIFPSAESLSLQLVFILLPGIFYIYKQRK